MTFKSFILFLSIFSVSFSGMGQALYFPPISGDDWETTDPASMNWCQDEIDDLYDFLEEKNTKAFILLKDGKIVLEQYFGTHTQTTAWYWASAGKTLTAFMVGIAQQEDYLSISDATSDYLGEGWTSCTPEQEANITIKDQLSMTTGLDDGVADHFCTLNTCLLYEADPGTRWAYHNGPYTLLDGVIEDATGMTLNAYTTQKLKNPTGMTGTFIPVDYNNVFFSTARSMARFGLLMLNEGNWDGTQIMSDATYFEEMTTTSQSLNEAYGYLWWLNGKATYMVPQLQLVFDGPLNPNAPDDMIAALGKNGQFINVVKSQNLVWIRMGEAPDDEDVPFLLNDQIWEHLNGLTCDPLSVDDHSDQAKLSVFPNPMESQVSISSAQELSKVEIYSMQGSALIRKDVQGKEVNLSLADLNKGMYTLKIYFVNGDVSIRKIVKE